MGRGTRTTFFSVLTSQSLDLQSSLHSTLSKYTILNKKEPPSKLPENYGFPFVLSNSITSLSPLLGITQTNEKSNSIIHLQSHNEEGSDQ
jgi:hypothetical protein